MELKCDFSNYNSYTCTVKCASITKPTVKSIQGTHMEGKSNADVKEIYFEDTNVKYFPRGLHKIFPGLTCLEISNCGLKAISRADLVGLENLVELSFEGNRLTSLLNNLFQDMTNLKFVSFDGNKLSRLSSKLLRPLLANDVEYVGFQNNTKIDSFYDAKGEKGSTNSLEELIGIIDRDCESRSITLSNGIQELWTSGRLSDFTIVVEQEKFKVHKNILAIHSSVFMAMFNNDNEESPNRRMFIEDFSSEVVKEYLRYIYTGELPDAKNAMDLFAMAVQYDVLGLKAVCKKMILENLNVSNAVDVLAFGNLYELDKMKALAFIELKKMFPGKIIHDEMMNQPERLKKLVNAHREFQELLAEIFSEIKNV